MRLSKMSFWAPTVALSEVKVVSHRLLLQAGYIHKVGSGVYTYFPLMLKVISNISKIIREEMASVNYQELLWHQEQNKSKNLDISYQNAALSLIQDLLIYSRKIPLHIYDIATKSKGEVELFGGLIQAHEFIVMNSYSFHEDKDGIDGEVKRMHQAFTNIFRRCNLDFEVVDVKQTETDSPKSPVFVADLSSESAICVSNQNGIELGSFSSLGIEFCRKWGMVYTDKNGNLATPTPIFCTIGVSRLAQMVVEQSYDDDGIVLPVALAPFKVIIIISAQLDAEEVEFSENLYTALNASGIETLIDDRDEQIDIKHQQAKLTGIPLQVLFDSAGEKIHIVDRKDSYAHETDKEEVITVIHKMLNQQHNN